MGELVEKVKLSKKNGNLHLLINDLTQNGKFNIKMPFIDICNNQEKNIWIIVDPDDVENIAKNNIKKVPNLATFVGDSIISTTDNHHWKNQRNDYQEAFDPIFVLPELLSKSISRAEESVETLKLTYSNFFNLNEFLLHETQAQLQLLMYGFENYTDKDNIYIRNAFYNADTIQMKNWAKTNVSQGNGPLMEAMQEREPLTDSENENNMLTFAFAGHDTTAHTLTWLIYEISKNNEFYSILQKEIDDFWIKYPDSSEWKLNYFKELKFTTRAIFETLRLWPAVANGTFRELDKDEEINTENGKIIVKKGEWVQIVNFARHRNVDLWGYDANCFNPNRNFTPDEIWNNEGYNYNNPYSNRFSPFSIPPRDCIGKNFSQMEMRVLILHLFKNFIFKPTNYQQEAINDITMGPKDINGFNKTALYIDIIPRTIISKL